MELYINSTWTEHYENVYVAEAIAYSENGNHATIYATGITAEEADTKLVSALRELELIPEEILCKEATNPGVQTVHLKKSLLSERIDKGRWHRLAALWGKLYIPFHRC